MKARLDGARSAMRIATLLIVAAAAATSEAAWLRPVVGQGHFQFTCDLVTLPQEGGQIDAVVLIAIRHREITFTSEAGSHRARVRVHAVLQGPDGLEVTAETTARLSARNASEAGSPTLQQIVSLPVRNIPFAHGAMTITVEDLNRRRPGLAYLATDRKAFATAVADWYAPPAREPEGLAVGGVVYLAHAPIRTWERDGRGVVGAGDGPWDWANPLRRYGLEAEALQIYVTIEPPLRRTDQQRAAARDLRLEIISDHLDLALVDTLRLWPQAREALAMGRSTAIYWEMDAGGLPPGSYRLGIAPLDTAGRGLLTGFDVVWGLDQLARDPLELLGEGRTVFYGDDLSRFEEASPAERMAMLERFWRDQDPSPEDPYNEAYAEFRRRIAHVNVFLGGFDENGALDPRGRVYILLGEPDGFREEPVPLNHQDLEDARVLVNQRYAPERQGFTTRVYNPSTGSGARVNFTTEGAIPMPYSYTADVNIRSKKTAVDTRVFQLWRYDQGGRPLFTNQYSSLSGGLRFLFVDKYGHGDFVLDATNATQLGD